MRVIHDGNRIFIHATGWPTPLRVENGRIHAGAQVANADQAIDLANALLLAAALAEPARTWTTADNIPLPDTLFARLRIDTWRRLRGLPKSSVADLSDIVVDELSQRSAFCGALQKALARMAAEMARGVHHAGASDN